MAITRIDYLMYPPTSFPYRDLLVLEHLDLRPFDDVCEIGVGSGETAARLARLCASVTGVDISSEAVQSIAYLEARHDNLRLHVADATRPETFAPFASAFSRVVSCDTLEHVGDPTAYFRCIARTLACGGRFVVTFPNEPRACMHGVTRFDAKEQLRAIVEGAGLTDVAIGAVHLSTYGERLATALGRKPVAAVRALRGGARNGPSKPQTFEQTAFHADASMWHRLAPAVNLYWFGVLRAMARRGTCFRVDWTFAAHDFADCQVLVVGRRPTAIEERIASHVRQFDVTFTNRPAPPATAELA